MTKEKNNAAECQQSGSADKKCIKDCAWKGNAVTLLVWRGTVGGFLLGCGVCFLLYLFWH